MHVEPKVEFVTHGVTIDLNVEEAKILFNFLFRGMVGDFGLYHESPTPRDILSDLACEISDAAGVEIDYSTITVSGQASIDWRE